MAVYDAQLTQVGYTSLVMKLLERITVDPLQCGGKPCVRHLRIRVIDVLDLLAYGSTREEVLEELPDLELEDIFASIAYAVAYRQTAREHQR